MNLLVTGAVKLSDEQFELLRSMGHSIALHQNESDELPVIYDWAEGIVCNGLFLHHPIEKFTSLRYIQLTSAGFDRVPMDYVEKHNITIYNARGVYSIPMAEFAVSSVLGIYKQWDHFRLAQAEHSWCKHRGLLELSGKNVCIVGCGNVGTECAKRFAAFGCRVIGVDAFPREDDNFIRMVSVDMMTDAMAEADVVVLTLPLAEETRHIISRDKLESLKDGCVLVNIARGAVIDTEALVDVLKSRDIIAVLDVFDEEPLAADSPLWDMSNVFITPHNSFVGEGNTDRMWNVILENLKRR